MSFTRVLFFVICSHHFTSSTADERQVTINDEIDEMIKDVQLLIKYDNKDILPIDDITETFEKKVKFVKIKGSFKASEGSVKSISSVYRTTDASLMSTPTSVTISVHLGLGHLEAQYDHYRAYFSGVSVSGDIRTTVKRFSVGVQITLNLEEDYCVPILDNAWLDYLDGVEVEVSGLGHLDWIFEKILEWIVRKYKDEIQGRITKRLSTAMTQVLRKKYFCDILFYI